MNRCFFKKCFHINKTHFNEPYNNSHGNHMTSSLHHVHNKVSLALLNVKWAYFFSSELNQMVRVQNKNELFCFNHSSFCPKLHLLSIQLDYSPKETHIQTNSGSLTDHGRLPITI